MCIRDRFCDPATFFYFLLFCPAICMLAIPFLYPRVSCPVFSSHLYCLYVVCFSLSKNSWLTFVRYCRHCNRFLHLNSCVSLRFVFKMLVDCTTKMTNPAVLFWKSLSSIRNFASRWLKRWICSRQVPFTTVFLPTGSFPRNIVVPWIEILMLCNYNTSHLVNRCPFQGHFPFLLLDLIVCMKKYYQGALYLTWMSFSIPSEHRQYKY